MARPEKEGIDYFPLDVDFFDNKTEIKPIISQYGADGVALLLYLYCDIYKNGYYVKVNDDYIYVASMDLRMNCNKIRQMLNNFLERSLFDSTLFKTVKVLTAPGIQRRYMLAVKERARKRKSPVIVEKEYWLIPDEEIPEVTAKIDNVSTLVKVVHFLEIPQNNEVIPRKNEINPCNNQQSKVKESNNNIYMAVIDYLNQKCGTKYQNTAIEYVQLILDKLSRGFNYEDFVKVIDIKFQEWSGGDMEKYLRPQTLFGSKFESYLNQKPKKEQKTKPSAKSTKNTNQFHNFQQREYSKDDYEQLESRLLQKGRE